MLIIKRHLIYVDAKSIKKVGNESSEENEINELLESAKKEAEEIIKNAKDEAQKIVENAKNEAQRIIDDAKIEAEEILNSAEIEINEKLSEIDSLKSYIAAFGERLNEQLNGLAKELAEKSFPAFKAIYRKILEKDVDEDLAKRRIESALEKIFYSEGVILRVSPKDSEKLSDVLESLRSQGFEVRIDPDLSEGDVLVETEKGIIDKTTPFRWKMIEDILDEIL